MNFDAIASELYLVAPAGFVAARDAQTARVRAAGERQLAAEIKALRRPGAGAWLANLLARHQPEQIVELLAVGEQLQEAHAQLAGTKLRPLTAQRRQMIAALCDTALQLAERAGHPANKVAARELEDTLTAATAGPETAEQLKQGRLVESLRQVGMGPGLDDLALPGTIATSPPDSPLSQAAKDAQVAVAQAVKQARATQERLQRAQQKQERLQQQAEALERHLAKARALAEGAAAELAQARADHKASEAELAAARTQQAGVSTI
jgi:hypothetical protein